MKEGAERIIRRIEADARSSVEAIEAEGAEQVRKIIAEAEKVAAERREQILSRAHKEAQEQKQRLLSLAQMEGKKELLAVKQALIDQACRQALEELSNLEEGPMASLMRVLILNAVEVGDEKVILSPRSKAALSKEFWEEINEALRQEGKKGELTVAEETREMRGGFVLQSGGVEINNAFDSLLESRRDTLEKELADLLFKD